MSTQKTFTMLSFSYEDAPAGADADARATARGDHKLFMNGETRHSIKEFSADIPQEVLADGRVCLRAGDAQALGLPLATFGTTRKHSVVSQVLKDESISRVANTSRKLMNKVWVAGGGAVAARGLSEFQGDVAKALAGATDEDKQSLTLVDDATTASA